MVEALPAYNDAIADTTTNRTPNNGVVIEVDATAANRELSLKTASMLSVVLSCITMLFYPVFPTVALITFIVAGVRRKKFENFGHSFAHYYWRCAIIPIIVCVVLVFTTNTAGQGHEQNSAETMANAVAEARELLGVEPNATDRQIVSAFRRKILLAHPDRGGIYGAGPESYCCQRVAASNQCGSMAP